MNGNGKQSWFSEHPWMTFFLAGAVINGIVTIVRGDPPSPWVQLDLGRKNRDLGDNTHIGGLLSNDRGQYRKR